MPLDTDRSSRSWLWLATGLLAESIAVALLLEQQLLAAGSAHLLSALALAAAAAQGRLARRVAPALAVFLLVLSLPAVGPLGVALVVLPAWRERQPEHDDGVIELAMPDFRDKDAPVVDALAPAPIEVVLRSNGSPQKRVEAVMTLRRMDAQRAVPLLRVALGDPHEDVRLLAYAILERREKELRSGIELALEELEPTSKQARPRAAVLKALAELHWELIHAGFVGGELGAPTLEAASRYGHAALLAQPDGSLALLLGRMRLRSSDAAGALKYLRAAAALGVSSAALAPLYAEVAFLLRRFDVIGPLLAQGGDTTSSRPKLDAVVQFWSTGGAS